MTTPPSPSSLSVVIPVYNEEANLPELLRRTSATLEGSGRAWEAIYVDDGSSDRSVDILREHSRRDPRIRVVELLRNFGQHRAVLAGLERTGGDIVVTLDADLQNPPEEIEKLARKVEEGFDAVGGIRSERQDSPLRKLFSFCMNRVVSYATGVPVRDYGCMLRAYRREVIEGIRQCGETSTYVPALANLYARRITEVPVAHAARAAGRSKYNLFRLARLMTDLITGFSVLPLRVLTALGLLSFGTAAALGTYIMVQRQLHGDAWTQGGTFTLFAVLFGFVGLQFIALAGLGEYLARIYNEVRRRPRYLVRAETGTGLAQHGGRPA